MFRDQSPKGGEHITSGCGPHRVETEQSLIIIVVVVVVVVVMWFALFFVLVFVCSFCCIGIICFADGLGDFFLGFRWAHRL